MKVRKGKFRKTFILDNISGIPAGYLVKHCLCTLLILNIMIYCGDQDVSVAVSAPVKFLFIKKLHFQLKISQKRGGGGNGRGGEEWVKGINSLPLRHRNVRKSSVLGQKLNSIPLLLLPLLLLLPMLLRPPLAGVVLGLQGRDWANFRWARKRAL